MRKDDDKVPSLHVFYLWCIFMPNTFFNIPYFLVKYLADGGVKDQKTSRICGGMWVTKLARSYGIYERGARNYLTMMHTHHTRLVLLFIKGLGLLMIIV